MARTDSPDDRTATPGHRNIAVFNDTRTDRGHYGCALVMDNLDRCLADRGLNPVFSLPFDRDWTDARDDLPRPGDIRAIVVNGEGTLHGSAQRKKVRGLAQLGQLAHATYGVPAILINATIVGNDPDFYRDLADFDRIFVRDSISRDELKTNGLTAEIVPDLSLSLPWSGGSGGRSGIGVTDSVLGPEDRALRAFARHGGHDFRPMTDPHVTPLTSRVFLRPKLAARKIRELTAPRDIRFDSYRGFLDWIASKSLIVTGRYHTLTLCLLTRTPCICLESNTPKIGALIRDAGLDPRRVISALPDANSGADLADSHAFGPQERANLDRFLATARAANADMFDRISDLIG